MADTYTVAQAAQILGISERRVRQLVNDGKLAAERAANGSLRLPQAAVNSERKTRRKTSARKSPEVRGNAPKASAPEFDVDHLASAVASAIGSRIEGQLEITRRAETLVRQELDEERAKRMEVEARLASSEAEVERLRQQLREASAQKRRRFFRKEVSTLP
jgi:excisionase family DNA binding protein